MSTARIIRLLVGGKERPCLSHWWEPLIGPKPHRKWKGCDGCTSSPDYWMGFAIWPACYIHDWHYSEDGPKYPRILADLIFRINIWRVLRAQGCPRFRAVYVSALYWWGVSIGGMAHFKGRGRRFGDRIRRWMGGRP